jgi:hypothetical protein
MYSRLADGDFVGLGDLSGGIRNVAPVEQGEYLRGGYIGQPMLEAVFAHECFGFIQNGGRGGRVSLGEFQAGEEYRV